MVDADRLQKLKELQKAGVNPFPYSFDRKNYANEIKENFSKLDGKKVSVAGRLMSKREHGKLAFADLADST